MKRIGSIAALTLLLALAGCGGGSGGGGHAPHLKAAGIYMGTLTVSNPGQTAAITRELLAIIAEDGRTFMLVRGGQNGLQLAGRLRHSGDKLTGDLRVYSATGSATSATVAADVTPQQSIKGTYTAGGTTGTLSLEFQQALYTQDSSLTKISDTYGAKHSKLVLNIDPKGLLTGQRPSQAGSGCQYNGHVHIIDGDFNVYAIDVKLSGCDNKALDGQYDGLAILRHDQSAGVTLVYGISNKQHAVSNALTRQ